VEEAGESAAKAAAAPAKNQDSNGAVVTPKSEDPSAVKEETPVAK
jgi:hypothetical protein